jgi:hypothetical protein
MRACATEQYFLEFQKEFRVFTAVAQAAGYVPSTDLLASFKTEREVECTIDHHCT